MTGRSVSCKDDDEDDEDEEDDEDDVDDDAEGPAYEDDDDEGSTAPRGCGVVSTVAVGADPVAAAPPVVGVSRPVGGTANAARLLLAPGTGLTTAAMVLLVVSEMVRGVGTVLGRLKPFPSAVRRGA